MTRLSRIMVAGLAAMVILSSACGRDGVVTPSPTSPATLVSTQTPEASPSPSPTLAPVATTTTAPSIEEEAFRRFLPAIQEALRVGDSDFFRVRAVGAQGRCDSVDVAKPERTVCSEIGDPFLGIGLAFWRSDEAGLVPLGEALAMIARLSAEAVPGASDEYGGAAACVYAIGTKLGAAGPQFEAVLTAMIERRPGDLTDEDRSRAVLLTQWRQIDDDWRLVSLLNAFVLGSDFLRPTAAGRGYIGAWERVPGLC